MNKIYIGKVVNTHGIKGEIRILSNFEYKDKVFKVNNKLIIGDKTYEIKSHRIHKGYNMVTLDDYNNINDVLFLLKKDVYFNEEDLLLDNNQVLDSELLTYSVVNNRGEVGEVLEVFFASETNKIIRVKFNKEYLIPYNSPMIKEINKNKKELVIELLEGME
ncbi:MAG: 16S rRNA processing protein RimM [Bacilli bacterium]|nr:16S rRNA processing protein RimM [Bacilli bacterium]